MEHQQERHTELDGESVEREIQQLTEQLATQPTTKLRLAQIGRKAVRRILDSWPLAITSLTVLALLTFLNFSSFGLSSHRAPKPSVEEELQRAKTLARYAAVEATAFLRERGRLPTSPEDIGLSAHDEVSFRLAGENSVLAIARIDGLEASFDSRNAPHFQGDVP